MRAIFTPRHPQKRHRGVLLAAVVVLGILGYLTLVLFHRLPEQHDKFLFLFVWELNSRFGTSASEVSIDQLAQHFWGSPSLPFDAKLQKFYRDEPNQGPDPSHPYLLVYQLDGLLSPVARRDTPFTNLPAAWKFPMQVGLRKSNQDLRARGSFIIEEVVPSGAVYFSWQGEVFYLEPNQGWSQAWIRNSHGGVEWLDGEGPWEGKILPALQGGQEVNILHFYNMGWWRWDQVVNRSETD